MLECGDCESAGYRVDCGDGGFVGVVLAAWCVLFSNTLSLHSSVVVWWYGADEGMGWIVIAYTVHDIPAVIDSELGQPFVAYCLQVLQQTTIMAVVAITIVYRCVS